MLSLLASTASVALWDLTHCGSSGWEVVTLNTQLGDMATASPPGVAALRSFYRGMSCDLALLLGRNARASRSRHGRSRAAASQSSAPWPRIRGSQHLHLCRVTARPQLVLAPRSGLELEEVERGRYHRLRAQGLGFRGARRGDGAGQPQLRSLLPYHALPRYYSLAEFDRLKSAWVPSG